MNISDFITNGILQDYCLGLLSADEERNVEVICLAYPEVAAELQRLRLALEEYAGSNKMWRKAELRSIIWESIKRLEDDQL